MSKVITAVNTNLAFSTLFTCANTLVQVLANEIVTANSAAGGGATTTGNGYVVGYFGASNLIAGTLLLGGNVVSTNTIYLGSNLNVNGQTIFAGNVQVNSTQINVGANVFINTTTRFSGNSTANLTVNSQSWSMVLVGANATINASGFFQNANPLLPVVFVNTTTSGVSAQNVDNWLLASYRGAEYTLTVTDNVANNYEITKINVVQSGGAAFHTEYGVVTSNSNMGTFGVVVNATACALQFTPTSTATTVKGIRYNTPV